MLSFDENLTKTKAFKENMDMHAKILFGDGKDPPRERKSIRARFIGAFAAFGKIFNAPNREIRSQQPDLPKVK